MRIVIETVPHSEQRYPTCGDWTWNESQDELVIKVSKLRNWKFESLVALHELVEVLLCKCDGVTQESVDNFDMAYERTRAEFDDSEPGDHPEAPYRNQHFTATNLERQMAQALGVNWQEYEREIKSL